MFKLNNFSENSLKAINLAKEESHRLGHKFIGSEQLLIGLLHTNNGATQLLNAPGVSLDAAQVEVQKIIGRGSEFLATEIPFTPNAKRAIKTANAKAYGQAEVSASGSVLDGLNFRTIGYGDSDF